MTDEILDYLGKAEGLTIHKNKGEKDITSPYGVYKYAHRDAKIFDYIDQLLLEHSIHRETHELLHSDYDILNATIERAPEVAAEMRRLASEFYDEYFSKIYLDLIPQEAQLTFLSVYTTSQYGGQKSVQAAINDLISNKEINNPKLSEDGVFGAKTKQALEKVYAKAQKENQYFGLWFEEKILRHTVMYYDKLAIEDPGEYKRFYKGWRNRLEALADSK
jgi:hypothetical protein